MILAYLQTTCQTCYIHLRESFANPLSKPTPLLLAAVSGSIGVVLLWRSLKTNTNKVLPPCPRGWPLIGNALELSDDKSHLDFIRVQNRYKLPDVFSLQMGPTMKFIVLNSHSVIKDAFVTQGDLFAGRPVFVSTETMNMHDDIFNKDYLDPTWNEGKAFIMSALRSSGFGTAKGCEDKILDQIENLAAYLDPYVRNQVAIDLYDIMPKASANVIFQLLFNKIYPLDDPELTDRVDRVRVFFRAIKDIFYMELIPVWFSKIFLKNKIKVAFDVLEEVRIFIREEIKAHEEIMDPNEPRDFLDIYLSRKKGPIDKERLTNTVFGLLPDAIDTIGAVLNWIILYMGHYREIQKKVYQEIQNVTGGNRKVTWSDRANLPYSEAVMLEVIRVACPVAITAPHSVIKDTYFRGYFIPKGVTVLGNIYAALRDPVSFPEPDTFEPERFLEADTKLVKTDAWIPFGMGRRKCIGEPLTNMETFLFMTNLIQKYEFTFPDNEPYPTMEPLDNIISRAPHPFNVILNHRD